MSAEERAAAAEAATGFRAVNERIRALEGELDEGGGDYVCECADAHCFAVVRISARQFDAVASSPGQLVVVPGHEEPEDEVFVRGEGYAVVRRSRAIGPPLGAPPAGAASR